MKHDLDELAGRLRALRRDVIEWGQRLWREEAPKNAPLVERLRLLDDLVALLRAAYHKQLPQPQAEGIRVLYEAEETFYRFGSWRLIPFNAARRERLERIGANEWYLFPWYEEWSDVPPDALDRLVEHLAGQPVEGMNPGRLILLRYEIEEDRKEAVNLARQVMLCRFLAGDFEADWAANRLEAVS